MLKKIYNSCDFLIRIGAYVSGLFIVIMTVLTFYEVIARSFFSKPTTFAVELSIYAVIGSCFLGGAYAVRTHSHITVDLLTNVDNDLWGIIKVLSVDNDKGNCTIAYKFYKNEEL